MIWQNRFGTIAVDVASNTVVGKRQCHETGLEREQGLLKAKTRQSSGNKSGREHMESGYAS